MTEAHRYLCIHGHFYQPPRENPWLEAVEVQDSAYPYHDWNARITGECYRPNGASRILDDDGWIQQIQDNYQHISFNFGPTLLDWLEDNAADVHRAIVEADRRGAERHNGHGPALAQPYNHMIMPPANRRDKVTQVRWGIADFEHHFKRKPEGMWLPETAVDTETLEVLAEEGILFTVLEPHQARRHRRIGDKEWTEAAKQGIDVKRPYRAVLPSGASLTAFFYDGPVSRAVAFEGLLDDGNRLANRLMGLLPPDKPSDGDIPPIVSIATDGETYGHHHRHGDMALAYAIRVIEADPSVELAPYAAYLGRHQPLHEFEVLDQSSWSCAHGVERWRSDCGCTTGGQPGWTQSWRAPLRNALDNLRDRLAAAYADEAPKILKDPWTARDGYVRLTLDRSPREVDAFLQAHVHVALDAESRTRALKLLEMQRHAMLMYTSCGWFFDELTRIETVQVMQYAARAVQLAEELFQTSFQAGFLTDLREARPNIPGYRDGADVFNRLVRPAMVDHERVAAHYAMGSLFDEDESRDRLWSFGFERIHHQTHRAGRARLTVGRMRVISTITEEAHTYTYAAAHLGEQSLHGGVRLHRDENQEAQAFEEVLDAFERLDLTQVIRHIDRHFGERTYSLRNLISDEKRRILDLILEDTITSIETIYERQHDQHLPLIRFLEEIDARLPPVLATTRTFVLNTHLRRALGQVPPDLEQARDLLKEAGEEHVKVDEDRTSRAIRGTIHQLMEAIERSPQDFVHLRTAAETVELARSLPFTLDLRFAEDRFWALTPQWKSMAEKAQGGAAYADEWCKLFERLSAALKVRIPR